MPHSFYVEKGERVMEKKRRLGEDESGATALEYGLILGLLATVILFSIAYFYQEIFNLFSKWGAWFGSKTVVS
jgi:Flp pilus assembly pilin Flp